MHSFLCVLLIHLFDLYLWPLGYFWSMCWIYALDFLLLYPILSLKTRCREMRLHSAEIYSGVLQLIYFHPLKCSTPLYGSVLRCSVLSFSTHRTLWIQSVPGCKKLGLQETQTSRRQAAKKFLVFFFRLAPAAAEIYRLAAGNFKKLLTLAAWRLRNLQSSWKSRFSCNLQQARGI